MHDVAWIPNPYSPFAPGGSDQGKAPPEETGGIDIEIDDGGGGSTPRGDRGDEKATVGGASAPRIPVLTSRRTRHVARD